MRICHISDTHSTFPTIPECDLIIHSGDFLPDYAWQYPEIAKAFQNKWVENRIETFRNWLKDIPFLICYGNHDWTDFCPILVRNGINAVNITSHSYHFNGINFYGYRWIPMIGGTWNGEMYNDELQNQLRIMKLRIQDAPNERWKENYFNCLVAHCPPYGILDRTNYAEHIGNIPLTNAIVYKTIDPHFDLILSGHCHEANGWSEICGIPVSNAATIIHLFDVNLETKEISIIK